MRELADRPVRVDAEPIDSARTAHVAGRDEGDILCGEHVEHLAGKLQLGILAGLETLEEAQVHVLIAVVAE